MSLDQMLLANSEIRYAVETRLTGGCCDGGKCQPQAIDIPADMPFPLPDDSEDEDEDEAMRLVGDSLLHSGVHPTSQKYLDLLDTLRELHLSKSSDYGCPSGTDPLANIRNGAKFVGIPAFKAAMVRLSDKVTRLKTYNATGKLHFEGVEDTLLDLASYSLLALVLFREEQGK
jgi:hypothetical protein